MKRVWEKSESQELVARINKATNTRGRIIWGRMSCLRGRTQKAMEMHWHTKLKHEYDWDGKKYVAVQSDSFKDVPRKVERNVGEKGEKSDASKQINFLPQKRVKQVRTYLWGLYKVETYA